MTRTSRSRPTDHVATGQRATTSAAAGHRHSAPWFRAQVQGGGTRARAATAGVAILALLGSGLAVSQFIAAAGSGPQVLARDSFSTAVARGWGSAPTGGAWTMSTADKARSSVSGGAGRISLSTDGRSPTARLGSVSSSDTDLAVTLRADKVPTASGAYVYVVGRYAPSAAQYFAKVRFTRGGTVGLSLGRRSSGQVESALVSERTLPGLTLKAGAPVRVRVQVTGKNPTTVRARAWAPSGAEPTGWQVQTRDSTAGLQSTGAVALSGYLSRGATNSPIVVRVDDLLAVSTTQTQGASAAPSPPRSATPSPTAVTPSPSPSSTRSVPPTPSPTQAAAGNGAGSASVGTTDYRVPSGAVIVAPDGSDSAPGTISAPVATVARAIAIAPAGGTVVLREGTYHESVTIPGKALTLQSYPGEAVWFDGSRTVTGFVRDGAAWRRDGWTVDLDHSPTYKRGAPDGTAAGWQWVNPAYPAAAYPDQVWIGDTELRQVLSRAAVQPGTFFVDPASKALVVGSDPGKGTVRASDLTTAFTVTTPGVTLRGFGVRRYATSVWMMGTVRVYGNDATLENLVIRDNATQGLSLTAVRGRIRHVSVLHNGLVGMHANYADGLSIDGLRAEGNNAQHFNNSPVSGGVKITRARGLAIRNSAFVDNVGSGLWTDESTYDGVIAGNDVTGNSGNGIVLELSQKFVVANNVVSGNGMAGLRLDGTGGVDIWNNSFARNSRNVNIIQGKRSQFDLSQPGHDPRQTLPDPSVPWMSSDIAIRNNVFDNSTGNALLAVEDHSHRYSAEQLRITTNNNVYVRASANAPSWAVVWSRGVGDPAVFASVAKFAAATGQERDSAAVDGSSLAAVGSAGSAEALPSAVAAAADRTAGVRHLGAWR